eukprot:EG_transcript_22834
MGMSRSGAVVAAYLMKHHSMLLRDALRVIRSRRPCVKPNKGFLQQLREYETLLASPTKVSSSSTTVSLQEDLNRRPDSPLSCRGYFSDGRQHASTAAESDASTPGPSARHPLRKVPSRRRHSVGGQPSGYSRTSGGPSRPADHIPDHAEASVPIFHGDSGAELGAFEALSCCTRFAPSADVVPCASDCQQKVPDPVVGDRMRGTQGSPRFTRPHSPLSPLPPEGTKRR